MRSLIYCLRCAAILWCAWSLPASADYSLSVTPRFSPDVSMQRIAPLATALGEALLQPVKVSLSPTFDDLEQRLKGGQIDIAFITPAQYPFVASTMEPVAIISTTAEGPWLRGLVIVRSNSTVHSPADLRGRSVAIVSEKSAGGYLSQKVALEAANIDVAKDMRAQVVADNKQENVVMSVYLGEADVGFVREDALHVADKYVPPSQIRVVMQGASLPNWCVVVKRSMSPLTKTRVRTTLLGMKANAPVLKALEASAFVAAQDSDFDVYRKALGVSSPAR